MFNIIGISFSYFAKTVYNHPVYSYVTNEINNYFISLSIKCFIFYPQNQTYAQLQILTAVIIRDISFNEYLHNQNCFSWKLHEIREESLSYIKKGGNAKATFYGGINLFLWLSSTEFCFRLFMYICMLLYDYPEMFDVLPKVNFRKVSKGHF